MVYLNPDPYIRQFSWLGLISGPGSRERGLFGLHIHKYLTHRLWLYLQMRLCTHSQVHSEDWKLYIIQPEFYKYTTFMTL